MSLFSPVNLAKWVEEHRDELKPPVGNKQVWRDERGTIVMVVGGPNARTDYHIQPTEELFYQLEGDIILRIMHPETNAPEDIVIREGEIYLLPANVPHCPRRPADTIGLVIEQPRPAGAEEKLRWYCESCRAPVYEAPFTLENIAVDLKQIMERFWADTDLRTCGACGAVVPEPTEAQPPAPAQP